MSAYNLPGINSLHDETKYQSFIPLANPHFSLKEARSIRNPKTFGSLPIRVQFFKNLSA